jgi:ArsR family transcriptional regulator, arsenate/arsenite/antimonite-responsive transcriptional repressor
MVVPLSAREIDPVVTRDSSDARNSAARAMSMGSATPNTRLQIVRLLVRAGSDGLPIGEVQARLGVPASTLAFHLRGLVTAGLVDQRREGRLVRCTPNYPALNETLAYVKENCCAGFAMERTTTCVPNRSCLRSRPSAHGV